MARKSKLTPELIETISGHIAKGAFDHVAAQACGISPATFYNWLAAAQKEDCTDELKLEFLEKVSQAKASARLSAESRVFDEDAFKWLRFGPGKTKPTTDGWTEESTLNVKNDEPVELVWADAKKSD